jgi:hypothetical protein
MGVSIQHGLVALQVPQFTKPLHLALTPNFSHPTPTPSHPIITTENVVLMFGAQCVIRGYAHFNTHTALIYIYGIMQKSSSLLHTTEYSTPAVLTEFLKESNSERATR